jgi:DNA-binding transcriptional MerR regulator
MSVLKPLLKIGELAKHTQVEVSTLRHYENLGLLQPVQRSSSGYRYYSAESIQRVDFIKKAQIVGFSLSEIQKIIGNKTPGKMTPGIIKQLLDHKIINLAEEIQRLQTFKSQLEEYRDRWKSESSLETYTAGVYQLIDNLTLPVPQQLKPSQFN